MAEKLLLIAVVAIVFFFLFTPGIRQLATQVLTSSEQITVPIDNPNDPSGAGERQLELVTLLGFDTIPAILDPKFVSANEASGGWTRMNKCSRSPSMVTIERIRSRY